jgi:hypothetical protein
MGTSEREHPRHRADRAELGQHARRQEGCAAGRSIGLEHLQAPADKLRVGDRQTVPAISQSRWVLPLNNSATSVGVPKGTADELRVARKTELLLPAGVAEPGTEEECLQAIRRQTDGALRARAVELGHVHWRRPRLRRSQPGAAQDVEPPLAAGAQAGEPQLIARQRHERLVFGARVAECGHESRRAPRQSCAGAGADVDLPVAGTERREVHRQTIERKMRSGVRSSAVQRAVEHRLFPACLRKQGRAEQHRMDQDRRRVDIGMELGLGRMAIWGRGPMVATCSHAWGALVPMTHRIPVTSPRRGAGQHKFGACCPVVCGTRGGTTTRLPTPGSQTPSKPSSCSSNPGNRRTSRPRAGFATV